MYHIPVKVRDIIKSQTISTALYYVCIIFFSTVLGIGATGFADFTDFSCKGVAGKYDKDSCLSLYEDGLNGLPVWFYRYIASVASPIAFIGLMIEWTKVARVNKSQRSSNCKMHIHMIHFVVVVVRLLVHLVIVIVLAESFCWKNNQLSIDNNFICTIGNYTRLCLDGKAKSRSNLCIACFVLHVLFLVWNVIELGYYSWAWRRKSKMLNEVTIDGMSCKVCGYYIRKFKAFPSKDDGTMASFGVSTDVDGDHSETSTLVTSTVNNEGPATSGSNLTNPLTENTPLLHNGRSVIFQSPVTLKNSQLTFGNLQQQSFNANGTAWEGRNQTLTQNITSDQSREPETVGENQRQTENVTQDQPREPDSTGSCREQTPVKEISAGLPKEETANFRGNITGNIFINCNVPIGNVHPEHPHPTEIPIQEENSPSKKYSKFLSKRIDNNMSVDQLPGIGGTNKKRLAKGGITKACRVLDQFLVLDKDKVKFLAWLTKFDVKIYNAETCYEAIEKSCDKYNYKDCINYNTK